MFFSRPGKIIFFTIAFFIIGINITWFWYYGVHNEVPEYITQEHNIHGFSWFLLRLQSFPGFSNLISTYEAMIQAVGNFTTTKTVLAVITLGASYIAEMIYYAVKLVVCFLWDILQIIMWVFGTLGLNNWMVL